MTVQMCPPAATVAPPLRLIVVRLVQKVIAARFARMVTAVQQGPMGIVVRRLRTLKVARSVVSVAVVPAAPVPSAARVRVQTNFYFPPHDHA
jgi:hypothetical protein